MDDLTPDRLAALDTALNEATLLGVELDVTGRRFATTLAVLALPADDRPPPEDPRIQLVLEPVGRLAVSLREGAWNDRTARSVPLDVGDLSSAVAAFEQLPIYGWTFFDSKDPLLANGATEFSLDLDLGPDRAHTLDLFQEGVDRFIELRVWFDTLTIHRMEGGRLEPASIDEVGAAGVRWWDRMYEGDPRTTFAGIIPLKD